MTDHKILVQHYYVSRAAAKHLEAAQRLLVDLDPSVNHEWDGLIDIKNRLSRLAGQTKDLAQRYKEAK